MTVVIALDTFYKVNLLLIFDICELHLGIRAFLLLLIWWDESETSFFVADTAERFTELILSTLVAKFKVI